MRLLIALLIIIYLVGVGVELVANHPDEMERRLGLRARG